MMIARPTGTAWSAAMASALEAGVRDGPRKVPWRRRIVVRQHPVRPVHVVGAGVDDRGIDPCRLGEVRWKVTVTLFSAR